VATPKERLDKHDREIAAIRQLLRSGMRLLVQNQQMMLEYERQATETKKELGSLAASQKAFIDSLRRGGNGHDKSHQIT